MAGRGRKKGEEISSKSKAWKVGVYGRRSFDDGETEESYTITNQKKMIEYFVSNYSDMKIIDYYSDDGYTGTNFERPEFKRLLNDIMIGKINTLIVKDLSRLGRNHREVGRYLEEVFPLYDLRVIAINDNVDSYLNPESINNIIVPVKNLMNENYSRDISKKVSSAYQSMAKRGEFVAGTTPYGYKLDSNIKHHLIIDETEVEIVRKIFEMALNGDGRIKICKYLNNNGILCRKEIQRRKKWNLSLKPNEEEIKYLWSTSTIGRMLSNESYIGNLVQLKTKRITFGSKLTVNVAEENYIRCENTHEPIISKEDFNKVQKIIKSNEKRKSAPKLENYSKFRGILKCGDCGRAMTRQEDFRGNRNISNYVCMTHLQVASKCSTHKIKSEELENIVLETIQLQVKFIIKLERSLMKLYFNNNVIDLENEYNNNIRLFEIKVNNLKNDKMRYYENWKNNKIPETEFNKLYSDIDNQIKSIKGEIESYDISYREKIKQIRKNDYWIGHFKRNRRIKKITKEVLHELVENIFVYENGQVEVTFKYKDEFMNLIKYLEEKGVINDEKMEDWSVSKAII